MADEQSSDAQDQQSIQDQVDTEASVQDQAPEAAQEAQDTGTTVEVDGESLSLEELKAGYMRQRDYTLKTKQLAYEKQKAPVEPQEQLDPEVDAALQVLKKAGVVTREDLEREKWLQEDERRLQKIFENNPDLRKDEKKIRAIGANSSVAWEDIIEEYGFKPKSALSRARSADRVMGQPTPKTAPSSKKVADIDVRTPEGRREFEAWKRANLKGSTF